MRLPDAGVLRPATPPPDFDLDLAHHLAAQVRRPQPRPSVALAHYGLVPDPIDTLHEAEGILRQWAEVAEKAFREGRDIAEALDVAFAAQLAGTDPAQSREARDAERHALERRGVPALARATAGPRASPPALTVDERRRA